MSVILLCVAVVAKPLAPIEQKAWSKVNGNVSGRLLVTKDTIEPTEHFQLELVLHNIGNVPLAFQTENPFTFTVHILNRAGKTVKTTSARVDILSSPQWAVLPRNCSLTFPVSIKSADGAKGSHLDITTLIWKLPVGKYRICGEYSSDSFTEFKEKPKNVMVWQGKIELPPVDVEIKPTAKEISLGAKKSLMVESDPTSVTKVSSEELQLPFLRRKYHEKELWVVEISCTLPVKLDPPVQGFRAFLGPQREILHMVSTPTVRAPIDLGLAEQAFSARGYALCALPMDKKVPVLQLLQKKNPGTSLGQGRKGGQQIEVFFGKRGDQDALLCLFLFRGYKHMISPPLMVIDGKTQDSPITIVNTAWLAPYDTTTKKWQGCETFPDGENKKQ